MAEETDEYKQHSKKVEQAQVEYRQCHKTEKLSDLPSFNCPKYKAYGVALDERLKVFLEIVTNLRRNLLPLLNDPEIASELIPFIKRSLHERNNARYMRHLSQQRSLSSFTRAKKLSS